MADIEDPVPCKLFCSVLGSDAKHFDICEEILVGEYGPVDLRSGIFPFQRTSYYAREMGEGLRRRFYGFDRLVAPGELAAIKVRTNAIEGRVASSQSQVARPVNLDPGLMARGRMILASTKDFSHRICIGQGIYAEVTLQFSKDKVITLPWTYPDYASGEYDSFFTTLRRRYHEQISAGTT